MVSYPTGAITGIILCLVGLGVKIMNIMKKLGLGLGASLAALAVAAPAQAIVNLPVPVNATVSYNGLQWAWASPLGDASTIDLSYQGTLGWRLPTAAELALAPTANQFIYAGANANLDGTPDAVGANWQFTNGLQGFAALAVPYFNNSFSHGDFCNGPGAGCGLNEYPWNSGGVAEFIVVRNLQNGVPEPAVWALLILGFGAIGGAMRRRQITTISFA